MIWPILISYNSTTGQCVSHSQPKQIDLSQVGSYTSGVTDRNIEQYLMRLYTGMLNLCCPEAPQPNDDEVICGNMPSL